MMRRFIYPYKWLSLCSVLLLVGLGTAALQIAKPGRAYAYPPLDPIAIQYQTDCINGTGGTVGSIGGTGYAIPTTVTITAGQSTPVSVTARHLVCNRSGTDMAADVHNDADSFVQETGARNVVQYTDAVNPWGTATYSNSPPNIWAGTWHTVDSGFQPTCNGIPATNLNCFSVADRTMLIDLSSITVSGVYHIRITGFGNIMFPGQDCSATATTPDGICSATNVIDPGFTLNVIVIQPQAKVVSSAAAACTSGITGWAYDPDFTSDNLTVQLYVDRPVDASAPDFTTTANQLLPLIDAGNGSMSSQPGHGFAFVGPVTKYNDTNPHNFNIRVLGVDATGAPDGNDTVLPTFTVGPCVVIPPPTCPIAGSGVFSGPLPTLVNQSFTLTVGVDVDQSATGNTFTITSAADAAGDSLTLTPGAITSTANGFQQAFAASAAPAGTYNVGYTFSSSVGSVSCSGQIIVEEAHYPYLGVYGNDVSAGGAFMYNGTCGAPDPDSNDIFTFLNANNQGAGAQFAAFALGKITGFNTDELGPAPPPPIAPGAGLAFANTAAPPGNFGGNNCISAYPFTPPVPPAGNGAFNGDFSTVPTGNSTYSNVGDFILNGGTIGNDTHITIYVSGRLIIMGNILYNNTGWASLKDIPSVTFIVQGNIYIDQNVTEVDGTYVAQPTGPWGGAGYIKTCTDGIFPYGANDVLKGDPFYTSCNKQLTIKGSLVAWRIIWLRTFGDTINYAPGENPYNSNSGGPPSGAAETIIDGPQSYLGQATTGTAANNFSFFTNLPPVL